VAGVVEALTERSLQLSIEARTLTVPVEDYANCA